VAPCLESEGFCQGLGFRVYSLGFSLGSGFRRALKVKVSVLFMRSTSTWPMV